MEEGHSGGELYEDKILEIYTRLVGSTQEAVREQAANMLFYHYLIKEQYEKAEAIMEQFKETDSLRLDMQMRLHIRQGDFQKAKPLMERKLLKAAGDIQVLLSGLQGIALKEGETQQEKYLADVNRDIVKTMELWEYGAYSVYLDWYIRQQDIPGCLEVIKGMWEHADKPWKLEETRLYCHIGSGQQDDSVIFRRMRPVMLELLTKEENLAFFRNSPEGAAFLESI